MEPDPLSRKVEIQPAQKGRAERLTGMPMMDLSPWLTSPLAILRGCAKRQQQQEKKRGDGRSVKKTDGKKEGKRRKREKGRKGEEKILGGRDEGTSAQSGRAGDDNYGNGRVLMVLCRSLAEISRLKILHSCSFYIVDSTTYNIQYTVYY